MYTSDNVFTVTARHAKCGVFMADGAMMEGPDFRQLDKAQMLEIVLKI